MPVIAKEALALEVPVVASDVCGLPEVVKPPWGVLVPPGDPRALADGIVEAMTLDARAGRAYVQEHCNVTTETQKLLDLMSAGGVPQTAGRPGRRGGSPGDVLGS
jgi:glycosyltransferase involved in cell wall biosynthesis